jgi:hypothetical protein
MGALRMNPVLRCAFATAFLFWCRLAAAQSDIVGFWSQPGVGAVIGPGNAPVFGFEEDTAERAVGPPLVDYSGIPLNEEARTRALSYDGALLGVPEHQCMPHPSTYSFWGPVQLRITEELDDNLNVVAYHVGGTFRRADRTIYMDGRPHPPDYAPHTWAGFSTGRWVGNTLVTTTTHIKQAWVRRNGVPTSDEAIVTTFYTRNENVMTVTWMVHDPAYLTETYTKSTDFIPGSQIATATFGESLAGAAGDTFFKCFPGDEVVRPDPYYVPNYLPWANPFTHEIADKLHVPIDAVLGGAETADPEYQDKLRKTK